MKANDRQRNGTKQHVTNMNSKYLLEKLEEGGQSSIVCDACNCFRVGNFSHTKMEDNGTSKSIDTTRVRD